MNKFDDVDYSMHNIFAYQISNLIRTSKFKPLTIGIHGPSNFGKSYILRRMQSIPTNDCNVVFNSWTYYGSSNIWASFLLNIIECVEEDIGWYNLNTFIFKSKYSDKQYLYFIIPFIALFVYMGMTVMNIWMFVGATSMCVLAVFVLKSINTVISRLSAMVEHETFTTQMGFMFTVKEYLITWILPLLKKKKKRLVIFLDDVDKCDGAGIVNLFKACSMLLHHDLPVVIVMAFDDTVINDIFHRACHLQKYVFPENFVKDMIQIPIYLPPPTYLSLEMTLDTDVILMMAQDLLGSSSLDDAYGKIIKKYAPPFENLPRERVLYQYLQYFKVFDGCLFESPSLQMINLIQTHIVRPRARYYTLCICEFACNMLPTSKEDDRDMLVKSIILSQMCSEDMLNIMSCPTNTPIYTDKCFAFLRDNDLSVEKIKDLQKYIPTLNYAVQDKKRT